MGRQVVEAGVGGLGAVQVGGGARVVAGSLHLGVVMGVEEGRRKIS